MYNNNKIKCLIAEMSCVLLYLCLFLASAHTHTKSKTEKKTRECKQSLLSIGKWL